MNFAHLKFNIGSIAKLYINKQLKTKPETLQCLTGFKVKKQIKKLLQILPLPPVDCTLNDDNLAVLLFPTFILYLTKNSEKVYVSFLYGVSPGLAVTVHDLLLLEFSASLYVLDDFAADTQNGYLYFGTSAITHHMHQITSVAIQSYKKEQKLDIMIRSAEPPVQSIN